jgi:hypothetical protein
VIRALARATQDEMPLAPALPGGAWPRRMNAQLSAAYCGEKSIRAFLKRVGPDKEYPLPCVKERGRVLWLKDDLDKAIAPPEESLAGRDVALDL